MYQALQPAGTGAAGAGDPAPRRGGRSDPTEWGILVALATVPGRVYSRFELINRVRGYEFEGYERTVDCAARSRTTRPIR
jgi:hypothetical protein